MADPAQLSRRERQIMEIVFAQTAPGRKRGEAAAGEAGVSATEVVGLMADPPTRTSVRTMLRILEQKGHLTHAVRGREFFYKPVAPRGQVGKSALQSVVRAFFGGSAASALAAYLADPKARLTAGEARELKALIDQAKKRGE